MNNLIANNTCLNNVDKKYGIKLYKAERNTVEYNVCSRNSKGIIFKLCDVEKEFFIKICGFGIQPRSQPLSGNIE